MTQYEIDNSWDALLSPGKSSSYFRTEDLPRLESPGPYCPATAWWLAELSRLIYRQDSDEIGANAVGPTRGEFLQEIGAEESAFFNQGGTQCALVRLPDMTSGSIHALVFRGTHDLRDWLSNLNALPVDWPDGGRVHRGFVEALDQVWEPLVVTLKESVTDTGSILYTGHSLGGALAILAAARHPPSALYTYGAPRVGDTAFGPTLQQIPFHRVVNDRDLVPSLPPTLGSMRFEHTGQLHTLAQDGNRQANPVGDPAERATSGGLKGFLEDLTERRWNEAPKPLADHAPINYVTNLDRLRLEGRS